VSLFDDILKGLPVNPIYREKIAELEAKYGATETENAILKDDLREAKTEITKLKEQVEKFTHIDSELSALEIKLLQFLPLPHIPNDVEGLAGYLTEEVTRIQYHLGRLEDKNYVISAKAVILGMRFPYALTQKGREYLVKNNLLIKLPNPQKQPITSP
jgi:hypothetical protein